MKWSRWDKWVQGWWQIASGIGTVLSFGHRIVQWDTYHVFRVADKISAHYQGEE